MYHYFGLHWACKLVLALSLLWANSSGHTAAWLGASTSAPSNRWVQAGVAHVGSLTFLYVEWNRPRGYRIETFPWVLGRSVRVVLQHRGSSVWRAGAEGHWTGWVWLPGTVRCSALETLGGGHGAARIAGKRIRG